MTRYHNKTTLVLQIVFGAVCFVPIAILLWALVSYGIEGGAGAGWAEVGLLLVWIFTAIAAGVLLVPFILLLVFCKKPWVALPVYLVLAVLLAVTFAVIVCSSPDSGIALLYACRIR